MNATPGRQRAPAAPDAGSNGRHAPDESVRAEDVDFLREVQGAVQEARTLVSLRALRLRLAVRRTVRQSAAAVAGYLAATFVVVAASLAVLNGVIGGLTEWTGAAWAGNLLGGGAVLLALGAAMAFLGAWSDRSFVASRTKRPGESRGGEA